MKEEKTIEKKKSQHFQPKLLNKLLEDGYPSQHRISRLVVRRCLRMLALAISLVILLIPTLTFAYEISDPTDTADTYDESIQALWAMVACSKDPLAPLSVTFEEDESLFEEFINEANTPFPKYREKMNAWDIAQAITRDSWNDMNAVIDEINNEDSLYSTGELNSLFFLTLSRFIAGVFLYAIIFLIAIALIMNLVSLIRYDLAGQEDFSLWNWCTKMSEGLLAAGIIIFLLQFLGYASYGSIEINYGDISFLASATVRLIFTKVNYLGAYFVILPCRIAGHIITGIIFSKKDDYKPAPFKNRKKAKIKIKVIES